VWPNSTKEDSEDVEREVAIMYHLGGHDNIVNLKQAYEDKNNVQLVRARGSLSHRGDSSLRPGGLLVVDARREDVWTLDES